ncbi:vWA domain-containing protein [Sphingomonas sp. GC_Shp_3]|uniref:vWA domain-containing protein n=1 Tax=Sphingomonas sp. GC_Shp_3 TaxID=2937383 RepID=UPI00226A2CE5|nr:vWA domain-containing protein [Sphingomonas sp. GC_Shp_3]
MNGRLYEACFVDRGKAMRRVVVWLKRLRNDERGNVLVLSALGLLLLLGMGGGALDLSRIYLVKTRMQQGCDAGVLAYRKSMQGTNVLPTTYPTALAYFNANFSPGRYGSMNTQFPQPTVDANVVVHGTATTTVPMALMQIFGFKQITLGSTCDAQLQLPNTDVMFVLDTTGSMTDTNPGDSDNKITGLRNAVLNFYNTLEQAKISGTQVRYGFVPYSNTVNVGLLLKREWIVNNWTYQSRQFDRQQQDQTGTQGNTVTTSSAWTPAITPTTTTSYGDPENCSAPANTAATTNSSSTPWNPSASAVPRSRTNYRTYGGDTYSATVNSSGQCVITKNSYPSTQQSQTQTVSNNPNAGQPTYTTRNYFWYKPVSYDVSAFKGAATSGLMAGASNVSMANVNAPSGSNATGSDQKVSWVAASACIEERKTLRPGETGTAWDMDVDSTPDTSKPETQWAPFLPALLFARQVTNYTATPPTGFNTADVNTTAGYTQLSSYPYNRAACPSPARKLQSKEAGLTSSALQSYLNALLTRGDTYHDIGFLWGLRLISKEGLFGSENTSAPDGSSIARNIIFMTDGDTESHIQDYDAYGLSALDRRRTDPSSLPSDSDQNSIVEDRLTRYCTIAKNKKGITVWVIAFGTDLTPLLKNCASQGRAFQANNSQQLNDTFAEIAAKIAQLRLTK